MTRNVLRSALLAALVVVGTATAAQAQTPVVPTPPGPIANTATATYTDERGNTYSPTAATASITVGLRGAPDVTVTPATNSISGTGTSSAAFTITNVGNGADAFNVSTAEGGSATITGYSVVINGGSATAYTVAQYTTMQADIAAASINRSETIVVTVSYSYTAANGTVSLTATSVNNQDTDVAYTGETDSATHTITFTAPTATYGVLVADQVTGSVTQQKGDTVLVPFLVTNTGTIDPATYTLSVNASPLPEFMVAGSYYVSDATGAAITTTGSLAPGGSETVYARFVVRDNNPDWTPAASYNLAVILTATHTTQATATDDDSVTVVVNEPTAPTTLTTFTKTAYGDDGTGNFNAATALPANVFPGDYVWYEIVATTGATTENVPEVTITDALDIQLTYVSHTVVSAGTIGTNTGGATVTVTHTDVPPSSTIRVRIRVQVK